MPHLEPASCERVNVVKKKRNRKKLKLSVSRYDIFIRTTGILFAMAMPYGGIAPFGLSFLAQERKLSPGALVSLMMSCIGSVIALERIDAAKYIGAGIIYIAVLFVLENGIKMTEMAAGVAAGAALILSGLMAVYWQGFDIMAVLLLLCESVMVVAGTLVMDKSRRLALERKFVAEKLTGDEKISLGAMTAIAVMSLKEMYIGDTFSVMNLVASVILLVIASGCGVGYSTVAGVVLGAVCGIGTDFFMPMLGAFGFCGFLSGVLSRFGKGGVIAGSVLANAVLIVYTNGALQSMLTVYEIIAAAVVFAVLPARVVAVVKGILCLNEKDKENIIKVKEGIVGKLRMAAKSFESMAQTLDKLSEGGRDTDMTDVATLFDAAADKICRNCRKSAVCWGKGFDSTYKAMFELLEVMERNGIVTEKEVSERFKGNCLNLPKLLNELNRQFDIYQLRRVWKSKLDESRELVGEQLSGVSKIIDNIAVEIDEDIKVDTVSADDICARLEGKGIRIQNLNVLQDRDGRYKVELTLKKCYMANNGSDLIKDIMENALKREIIMYETVLEDRKTVRLDFCEEERFVVETDHASIGASEKNGDNYRFSKLKSGKYVIMLSDGMGTGSRASRESEAIIELLDSFIEAGFDSTVAVKLINSVMIMKSESETFVTIDMCIIDLYTGRVEFIKTGAEPSFIIHKNAVRQVKSASLPVGVIAGAEADITRHRICEGDTVVMMTDGLETRDGCGNHIKDFIEKSCHDNISGFANSILEYAINENNGTVKDDMTVICAHIRLKERAKQRGIA